MSVKDELLRRLKLEQQMQNYNNRKQALQNQTDAASQSGTDNSGAYTSGVTGSSAADTGLDLAASAAAATGTPIGLGVSAAYNIYKGINDYFNQKKNANTALSQAANAQTAQSNMNDYNNKKSDLSSQTGQNLNRLAALQNTDTSKQSLNDMLNTALSVQPSYSIGDDYAQKAQEGINNAQTNSQIQSQNNDAIKSSIINGVKDAAMSTGKSLTGGANPSDMVKTLSEKAGIGNAGQIGSKINDSVGMDSNDGALVSGTEGAAASLLGGANPIQAALAGAILGTESLAQTGNIDAANISNLSDLQPAGINTPAGTQTLQDTPLAGMQNEGSPTGYAADITDSSTDAANNQKLPVLNYGGEGAETPVLGYNGSAQQELDSQKSQIMQMFKDKMKGAKGTADNAKEALKSGLRDFYSGYQDNSQNSFTKGDIFRQATGMGPSQNPDGSYTGGASQIGKSVMNRLGEAAGTGQRIMANPWTQAGIAALATKATGGDWADTLNNAYKYGTAKATSNYYNSKLNPNTAPAALQNFTKDDYSADALADYRETLGDNAKVKAQAYLDKNNPTYETYLNSLLYNKDISLDEYNDIVSDPDYNPNARISLDAIKNQNTKNYQQGQLGLGKEKNQIGWMNAGTNKQNANTRAGQLQENIQHNRNTEEQKQKELEAKIAKDQQKQLQAAIEAGNIVKMIDPNDGSTAYIPREQVKYYQEKGAKIL